MENNPQNQVISEKIITESAKKQALNPEKTSKTTEGKGKEDEKPKVQNIVTDNANDSEIEDESIRAKRKEIAKKFLRINDDYFKIIYRPDQTGKLYKSFLRTSKTTITDDHTKAILKYIAKYEDFVFIASHTDYKQVINGFFNEYNELSHKPIDGKYDTILHIIKHVFGQSHYDFALDYLQLIYTKPYQRLPILLLESDEKNTGKSTFGTLMYKIFQDNAIKIGNNDIQSDFNAIWIKRLAIIVDETSLEKQGIMQMLKRLSTETGKVTTNEKNKAQREVNFIGKFIFMSNDEGKALPIEEGDTRFAVFKVPTFQEKGYPIIADIEAKIEAEIPAFLSFLLKRTLVHKPSGERMYFDRSVYKTEQHKKYMENNVSKLAKAIQELVNDTFEMFPEQNELKFSVSNIVDELKDHCKSVERVDVKDVLKDKLKMEIRKKGAYTYHSLKLAEKDPDSWPKHNGQNNAYYLFTRPNT